MQGLARSRIIVVDAVRIAGALALAGLGQATTVRVDTTDALLWPNTLPQEFLAREFGQSITPNVVIFDVDEGAPLRRPRHVDMALVTRGLMLMTPDQWDAFEDFRDDELQGGAREFWLPDPLNENALMSAYLGERPARSWLGSHWQVEFNLVTVLE